MVLSIREIESQDIEKMVDYFHNSDEGFIRAMGAEKSKLPLKKEWLDQLIAEFKRPLNQRNFHYVYWCLNEVDIGHSNINQVKFGKYGTMHLHLWTDNYRQMGMGQEFLKQSIAHYFEKFQLQKLICEPYTENAAPNRTLLKLGFKLIKTYETIPGKINFHQWVNRFELLKEDWAPILK